MSDLAPHPSTPPNLKARVKASYDAIAPAYNAWTTSHNVLRERYLARLLEHVQPPGTTPGSSSVDSTETNNPTKTALDLGCGAGVPSTAALLAAGLRVQANDLSTTQLALARARFADETRDGRVEWLEGDMMALEFAPASLDAVVALYSLVHLTREEQAAMVGRVAGWLRPGGVVLVNFGLEETEGVTVERWLGRDEGWMYWSAWGAEKSLGVVREAGLEVLVEEISPPLGDSEAEFLWVIARKV
ncbi:sterol 24-C-methyltransferase [Parachaetomium inaequale]|uniref:Sterol 24-C-methyltransferase n=1 Tax=Parachaetomium inaequale TaxID=2588326 RepID=A0AAN6PMH1_9PEZI|nr:sterol 24-C-methyltransferase [Parachaetomium inaequale]